MKGSLGAVATIICVIIIWINVSSWNYIYIVCYSSTWWYCCASANSWCRLLAIIKCLQHSIVPVASHRRFWQQKIVLKHTLSLVAIYRHASILNFRSVTLNILHKSWLSIIHHVIRSLRRHASRWAIVMLSSFVSCWIEKTSSCCILSQSKVCHIHVLILAFVTHHYKTVILLCAIPIKASISLHNSLGSTHWPSSIWKFPSLVLFVWLVQCIGVGISSRFATSACCSMSAWLVYCILCPWKYSHVYLCSKLINICYVLSVICLVTQNRLFSLMIRDWHILIYCWIKLPIYLIVNCVLIFNSGSINLISIFILYWVASSSMSSLLSQFSLSYCFWYRWGIWMTSSYSILKNTRSWIISIIWIEKLCSHHHLLLLIILTTSRSFPLIDKIKQMSLICINTILISNPTCSSNSIISNSTCSGWRAHCTWSFRPIPTDNRNSIILILCLHSIENCVSRITLSKLCHKVSIEHCLSHLNLILILI